MSEARTNPYLLNCPRSYRVALGLWSAALICHDVQAAPLEVRYPEGVSQGFVTVTTLGGTQVGEGELSQSSTGTDRVVSRMIIRFQDGSLHEETVLFSQKKIFTLLSYKLIQRGPLFQEPVEIALETKTGNYTIDVHGKEPRHLTGRLELPPDTYNGMTITLLKNLPAGVGLKVHMLDFLPEPKLYTVELNPLDKEPLRAGGSTREVTHFVLKPVIGWMQRMLAAVVRKTIPEHHFWLLKEEIPAFVRFEGPLQNEGPAWRIEQVNVKFRSGK